MENKKQHRSKNPDLLFEDIRKKRAKNISKWWCEEKIKSLNRITIFATHRCNFFCKYCNGPHLKKKRRSLLKEDLSLKQFKKLLEDWKRIGIKHIHFTGGEATLNKNLPKFIKLAKNNGILTSLTTNGSAKEELYKELIENGLTEIRISIDSDNEKEFNEIVGVRGAFNKVIKNISEIVKLREEGKDIFLILNACVGEINLEKIKNSLKFFISLKPDDIKLLVIAEDKQHLLRNKNNNLTKELFSMLEKFPKNEFILLRKKIKDLFNPCAFGLKDKRAKKLMRQCFIPFTERTLNSKHYYPCSIYLRYYGKPIGNINESFEEQQRKINEFVRKNDCKNDSICKKYCTNCCKEYNICTNQEIEKIKEIRIKDNITKKEIENTKKEVLLLGSKSIKKTIDPFVIIKPCGMNIERKIISFLKSKKIIIKQKMKIKSWYNLSKAIYCWPLIKKEIIFTLEMTRGFKKMESNNAEVLYLDKIPLEKLKKIKYELRDLFPDKRGLLKIGNKKRTIISTVLHSPDKEDLERESNILTNFLKKNGAAQI